MGRITSCTSRSANVSVSMRRMRLIFPLGLKIRNIGMLRPISSLGGDEGLTLEGGGSAMTSVRGVIMSIRLLPLFDGRIVISRLGFAGVGIGAAGFVRRTQVGKSINELRLVTRNVSLNGRRIGIGSTLVSSTELSIRLDSAIPPSAAPDAGC